MWKIVDETLLTYTPNVNEITSRCVLGFDFDSTLVEQKSDSKYPIDENDWKPLYSKGDVPSPVMSESDKYDIKKSKDNGTLIRLKLKEQYDNGNLIVIFSNQSGVSKGKLNIETVKSRFQQFMNYLNFPVWCYIATAEDHYRKPSSLMWTTMLNDFTEKITRDSIEKHGETLSVSWDHQNFAYIGDAAGREKGWKLGRKKDFACSDRKFAKNCGIKFLTPEEFFLQEAPTTKYVVDGFDPQAYLTKHNSHNNESESQTQSLLSTDKQEMVILVGPPSCGKSTFSRRFFPNYIRINRDEIGTMAKCIKATKDALKQKKSVIIDNLNGTKKARKEFIDCVPKGVDVKCIVFDVEKELALHLNLLRVKMTKGKTKKIPDVVYHTYYKYFEQPSNVEGISKIVIETFEPIFEDEHHRKLFLEHN